MNKNFAQLSLELHEKHKGKIAIASKVPLNDRDDLSIAYTPGVAQPCLEIAKDKDLAYKYTAKGNLVAVVTDGSAVLGLGNIGGIAGMPVMEGKAILFKEFGDVDAFPICLATQDPDEIIRVVQAIAPTFGGINLEDIKAPECFYIEEELKKTLDIPVFHDDQHGTAIVVLAALTNALRLTHKDKKNIRVVVNGAGAAGIAVSKLLHQDGILDITLCDTNGAIYTGRKVGMNKYKDQLAPLNKRHITGTLNDAVHDADVFIGLSKPGVLTAEMVKTMRANSIIFAMANPTPEIMPDIAKAAGAAIIGTGRSDFPNQINNVLAFPGIFRGALDAKVPQITEDMKIAAAHAIATYLPAHELNADKIIPSPLDRGVSKAVALAVMKVAGK